MSREQRHRQGALDDELPLAPTFRGLRRCIGYGGVSSAPATVARGAAGVGLSIPVVIGARDSPWLAERRRH